MTYITVRYVACPHCNESTGHTLDDREDLRKIGSFGAWGCNSCGGEFTGEYIQEGFTGEWSIKKVESPKRRTSYDLLVLPPSEFPRFFVLEGPYNRENEIIDGEEVRHQKSFFYQSHSCPSNWLDNIIEMIVPWPNGELDDDPHGDFLYVRSIWATGRLTTDGDMEDGEEGNLNVKAAFPEMALPWSQLKSQLKDI